MSYDYDWYGEEIAPRFVGLDGKPIEKTPYSHPYSYDEFVKWKSEDFVERECYAVYSDRLLQWDRKKFDKACQEVFKNHGQMFGDRKPEDIEKFLSIYLGHEVKLKAIVQGCYLWNGFPYWAFLYKE